MGSTPLQGYLLESRFVDELRRRVSGTIIREAFIQVGDHIVRPDVYLPDQHVVFEIKMGLALQTRLQSVIGQAVVMAAALEARTIVVTESATDRGGRASVAGRQPGRGLVRTATNSLASISKPPSNQSMSRPGTDRRGVVANAGESRAMSNDGLSQLQERVRRFAEERDWGQFHTPKNLVMALAGEVGELIEHFQWLTPAESDQVMADPTRARAVADEAGRRPHLPRPPGRRPRRRPPRRRRPQAGRERRALPGGTLPGFGGQGAGFELIGAGQIGMAATRVFPRYGSSDSPQRMRGWSWWFLQPSLIVLL